MKPMISSLSALTAVFFIAAPIATAQTCSQQATQLQERQVEAQALAEARLELVDKVEEAGDAWENAEALRHFSDENAEQADATKTEYESLKADLMQKEVSLQNLVGSLNQKVEAYNAACVKS